jgi:hypothetical protein
MRADAVHGQLISCQPRRGGLEREHRVLGLLDGGRGLRCAYATGPAALWGDGGYQGQMKRIHRAALHAQDMTSRVVKTKAGVDEAGKRKNRTKARVRAKVEWPFRLLKRVFGLVKVRYRGLKKNHEWLCAAFALVNLYQNRRRLAKLNQLK